MSDRQVTVNITTRTMLKSIFWIAAAVLFFKFLGHITHALTLIFTSFFLALALNPIVSWMTHKLKIDGRVRATAAAYFTVVAFIIGFMMLVIPPLVDQSRDFVKEVPKLVSDFQKQDSSLANAARKYNIDDKLSQSAHDFASNYSNFGGTVIDTGKRVVGGIIALLIVLTMTFMMLVEGPKWLEALWQLVPARKRAHHKKIAYKMYRAVSGYVNAQVILAFLAGTFSLIALTVTTSIFNVSLNVVALAGIVALLGLIPMIGHPISSTIVLIICLLQSPQLALVMLIYFLVYYELENLTFQPYIQSKLSELTPLLVFGSAIIGIEFAGFIGAFVAIPIATCIKILVEDQLEKRGFNYRGRIEKA